MNNVLIPTDFSFTSINYAAQAVRQIGGRCNVYLFHALDVPESLVDVMMRSGLRGDGHLITEELRVRCKKIKNEHPAIANIYMRIMYGSTLAAFRSFAEANSIDFIFLPESYKFRSVVRDSVDPTDWFRKAGIPVVIRDLAYKAEPGAHAARPTFTLN